MTRRRASRPFEEYHEEQMRDPTFAGAYRALEPEFQVARQVIRLRLERGLSQDELAKKAGTGQPKHFPPGKSNYQPLPAFSPKGSRSPGRRDRKVQAS
jgi:hypothetical protein